MCPRKFNVGAKGAERDKKIQKRPDPKWSKGRTPSGWYTTQVHVQLVERKGLRNFLSLISNNKSKSLQIWFKGATVHPKLTVKLGVVCSWDFIHDGHMNTGVLESSFWIAESCWGWVYSRGAPAWGSWETVELSYEVEPGCVSVSIYVVWAFPLAPFLVCLLCPVPICFSLILLLFLRFLLVFWDRKDVVDLDGREGEELGIGGGEAIVRIYCMKKITIFKKLFQKIKRESQDYVGDHKMLKAPES